MKCTKQIIIFLIVFILLSASCSSGAEISGGENSGKVQITHSSSETAGEIVSATTLQRISTLEWTCAQDLATPPRGLAPLAGKVRGSLLEGARSLAMAEMPSVAIITGFWIIKKEVQKPDGAIEYLGNASETDGPVGTAHLAAGLARAGIPVRVVTDKPNESAVRVALEEATRGSEVIVPLEVVPWDLPDTSITVDDTLQENMAKATSAIAGMVERWKSNKITHVMALERVGPARSDGRPHNMVGVDVRAYTAPLHLLYEAGGWTKLAVGDGGNEIGMGSLDRELIQKSITNGKGGIIASATSADYLQVCGVSNWGGPTFLFALALLRPEIAERLLAGLTPEKDRAILWAVVEKGPAVDGIRGTRELSVDNMDWEKHAELLKQLWRAYSGR
jgi:hypothetical protein